MNADEREVLRVLRDAKELIRDARHWTNRATARDQIGHIVSPDAPNAVCWCADGAIYRVSGGRWVIYNTAGCALSEATEELFNTDDYFFVNDKLGHNAILRAFDRAIEKDEASE